jgi:hypothetical protein
MNYKDMVLKNRIRHIKEEEQLSGGFLPMLGMMLAPSIIKGIFGRGVQSSVKAYQPLDMDKVVSNKNRLIEKSQMTGTNMTGGAIVGAGKSGGGASGGFISSMGIPIVSDIAGLFGLGRSGGRRSGGGRSGGGRSGGGRSGGMTKKVSLTKQTIGTGRSGGGRSGGSNPWITLVSKVKKDKGFKTVKETIEYIKKNNLYKK